MQLNPLCFLFLLLILNINSGRAQTPGSFTFKQTHYNRINDTLYAAEFEAQQIDYKRFLETLLPYEYEKCMIDSSLWGTKFTHSYMQPMSVHYHTHQAFGNYPVVNISHFAAVRYCEWLNRTYKASLKKPKIIFRLPTQAEWILLTDFNPQTHLPNNLLNGKKDSCCLGELSPSKNDSCYLENIRSFKNDAVSLGADGGYFTVRVDSYWPNKFGLYNIIGNAAEMTTEEGIQKGGSWLDNLEDCFVEKTQAYSTPDPRVGFRVVAVLQSQTVK